MVDHRTLSRRLLEQTLKQHRPLFIWPRVVNPLAAKFAGEVALLLGFDDLVESFRKFAARVPANSENPDDTMWAGFTTIRDFDTVSAAYPVIDQAYLDTHVDSYQNEDFQVAFADAQSEYEKECVLITQVIKQQIAPALLQSKTLSYGRMWNIHFLATIESFRTGDADFGEKLLKMLPRDTMCEWGKPQMALAITGRAGWGGYPYPDN